MADIAALKAEIDADPLTRGYAGMDDAAVAASLMAKDRAKPRTSMSGRKVRSYITNADYDGITDPEKKTQLLTLLSSDDLNPFGFAANVIKDILPNTGSLAALAVARDGVDGQSRAEELSLGTISEGAVIHARSL